jgi:hypothetical protein
MVNLNNRIKNGLETNSNQKDKEKDIYEKNKYSITNISNNNCQGKKQGSTVKESIKSSFGSPIFNSTMVKSIRKITMPEKPIKSATFNSNDFVINTEPNFRDFSNFIQKLNIDEDEVIEKKFKKKFTTKGKFVSFAKEKCK